MTTYRKPVTAKHLMTAYDAERIIDNAKAAGGKMRAGRIGDGYVAAYEYRGFNIRKTSAGVWTATTALSAPDIEQAVLVHATRYASTRKEARAEVDSFIAYTAVILRRPTFQEAQ